MQAQLIKMAKRLINWFQYSPFLNLDGINFYSDLSREIPFHNVEFWTTTQKNPQKKKPEKHLVAVLGFRFFPRVIIINKKCKQKYANKKPKIRSLSNMIEHDSFVHLMTHIHAFGLFSSLFSKKYVFFWERK